MTSSPNPAAERRARLAALGIEQWRRRPARPTAPDPGLEPADKGPVLLRRVDQPVATVLVDWPEAFSPDDDTEAATLLTKILAATGHPPERFEVYQVGATPPKTGGDMLWFTQRAVSPASHVTLLPSLQSMLSQPALKRVAWTGLKQWMARHGAAK